MHGFVHSKMTVGVGGKLCEGESIGEISGPVDERADGWEAVEMD